MKKEIQNLSFEQAFERLEKILEEMNSGKLSLASSLELFEEANALIIHCDSYLSSAEQKVETLIKNRNGELALDKELKPLKEPFLASQKQLFSQEESPL